MSVGRPHARPAPPELLRRVVVPHVLSLRAPQPGAVVHALDGQTMGTTWSVKLASAPAAPLPALRRAIQDCLDEVVAQMSTWEHDSDVSRYNRAPPGTWHTMPPACFRVLAQAWQVARDSGGAYDPTVGALVNLWGFGPQRHHVDAAYAVPQAPQLEAATTGWQRVALDPAAYRILQPGGVAIDLSAIAKGYGVDQVSRCLQAHGIDDHLVEVGGELRGCGAKPDGQPWWVALEAPPPDPGGQPLATPTVIALHGLAVATSGDYRRSYTVGGRRHSHTIDPRTARPIAHGLASVTVLHAECMIADAQSTALMVLGLDAGLAHAQRHALAALFVQRTARGFEAHASEALEAMS